MQKPEPLRQVLKPSEPTISPLSAVLSMANAVAREHIKAGAEEVCVSIGTVTIKVKAGAPVAEATSELVDPDSLGRQDGELDTEERERERDKLRYWSSDP